MLHLPPDFSESKQYPPVIHVYQEVIEEFKLDWGTYLTTREGFIYSLIDERIRIQGKSRTRETKISTTCS